MRILFLISSWILLLFPFFSYSRQIERYIPTPLSSSLGKSGRAGGPSLEYHILNPAAFSVASRHQYSGFYLFSKNKSIIGMSTANKKPPLPYALSWIWSESHRVIASIAGNLGRRGSVGLSVHYFPSDQYFYPHIGFIYKLADKIRMGFTIDFVNAHFSNKQTEFGKDATYGFGIFTEPIEYLRIWADTFYKTQHWSFSGGLEFVPSSHFSIRLGQSYPKTAYTLGLSLNTNSLILHYTWIEKEGHNLGFQF